MKINEFNLPDTLLYTDKYTWVRVEENTVTVGLTDFGLSMTKEIVYIDLPGEGQEVKKDDDLAIVESIKWSGHVVSPVSGKVVEVHRELFDEPSKMNKDPYGEGWICRIELSNSDELEDLMDSKKASDWVRENL